MVARPIDADSGYITGLPQGQQAQNSALARPHPLPGIGQTVTIKFGGLERNDRFTANNRSLIGHGRPDGRLFLEPPTSAECPIYDRGRALIEPADAQVRAKTAQQSLALALEITPHNKASWGVRQSGVAVPGSLEAAKAPVS